MSATGDTGLLGGPSLAILRGAAFPYFPGMPTLGTWTVTSQCKETHCPFTEFHPRFQTCNYTWPRAPVQESCSPPRIRWEWQEGEYERPVKASRAPKADDQVDGGEAKDGTHKRDQIIYYSSF